MRRVGATSVALALALGSAIGVAGPPAAGAAKAPRSWDEKVLPFVEAVEEIHGLEFERPVAVRFLDDRRFRRELRAGEEELTESDRREARRSAGQLRALGLIEGDVDLLDASGDLLAETVLGYYDPATRELVVRGIDLEDPERRLTLVHELTHALQDQHFDLDRLDRRAAKSSGRVFALTALVEGDASDVESAYEATLSEADRARLQGDRSTVADEALPEGIPPALETLFAVPYALGPYYVAALPDRNAAFGSPPVSEEQILDPAAGRRGEPVVEVPTPQLAKGERASGEPDDFGAFTLFLMLATRTDPATALRAVTGWGGDRYQGYRAGGRECLRAAFRGDQPGDTDELATALQAWASTLPAGMASVRRVDQDVVLDSCETEGVTQPTEEALADALEVLAIRLWLVADVERRSAVDVDAARCAADGTLTDPVTRSVLQRVFSGELARIGDLPAAESRAYSLALQAAFSACGVPLPRS